MKRGSRETPSATLITAGVSSGHDTALPEKRALGILAPVLHFILTVTVLSRGISTFLCGSIPSQSWCQRPPCETGFIWCLYYSELPRAPELNSETPPLHTRYRYFYYGHFCWHICGVGDSVHVGADFVRKFPPPSRAYTALLTSRSTQILKRILTASIRRFHPSYLILQ